MRDSEFMAFAKARLLLCEVAAAKCEAVMPFHSERPAQSDQ